MMIDRKNRIFEDKDVKQVADMYQNWLKGNEDIKGFCKSAELVEIEKHKFVLTSVRYV
ncbi:MAG: N-6 DNA methylase [Crocinitomicaceae bacterium]|nr:N-6 DNA methylase [Crocinitomicaceae bacterium]